MGKTETIKERAVWVYLPSLEQKEEWGRIANQNDISLSKWIIQIVEDTLHERETEVKSRKDIEKENKNLRSEISSLQSQLKQLSIIRENLEREIRKYRAEPFLSTTPEGGRQFDIELIDMLRNAKGVDGKHRYLDDDEVLQRLGVDLSETDSVKAISNQLSRLEKYGLVASSTKGWRWQEI